MARYRRKSVGAGLHDARDVRAADPAGLDFIAENLSVILEQGYEIESLSAEVARNYEEFSLLWSLSSKLASVLDVRKVCEIAADEIMSFCPSKSVSIVLVEDISSDIISGLRHPVSPALFLRRSLWENMQTRL